MTFSEISESGSTTLSTSSEGPELPGGFKLGDPPTYYELTTMAVFSGSIQVCISYNDGDYAAESALKLYHFEDPDWVDITDTLDEPNNIICGTSSSLSPFALLEPLDSDGDGIAENDDLCPDSDQSPTVIIDGCQSGVPNPVDPSGCTISDLIAGCAASASNHGSFVSCVAQTSKSLKKNGTISGAEKGAIQSCAAQG